MNCPFPFEKYPLITMAHGGGGKFTQTLIDDIFSPVLGGNTTDDGASLKVSGEICMTTDSFVVQPIFFPGGDIGSLAVHGTCNDLAMCGAQPRYLSCSFIIEEGFPTESLFKVVSSMRSAADEIGVQIVTGDTKVVERDHGDGIYINTTGIGEYLASPALSPDEIQPGDVIAVNGDVGRHGSAIMAQRDNLKLSSTLESDSAHLFPEVKKLLDEGVRVHCLRDLTRGGIATSLCELSESAGYNFLIQSSQIQVQPVVQNLCELLGLDPLYVANEGRMVAILPESEAERSHLTVIGRVTDQPGDKLILETGLGSKRVLRKLSGEQLPRIC